MKGFFVLVKIETKQFFKDKSFYIWALMLPIIFLLIFSGMGGKGRESKTALKVLDNAQNKFSREFIIFLKKEFDIKITNDKSIPILKIDKGFELNANRKIKISVIFPDSLNESKEIFIKIGVVKAMSRLLAKYKFGIKNPETFLRLRVFKNKTFSIPSGTGHALVTVVLVFILFNAIFMGIQLFYSFKTQKLLDRISISPLGKRGILLFFVFEISLLMMLSVTFLYIIAFFFFNLKIGFFKVMATYFIFFLFSVFVSSLSVLFSVGFKRKEASTGFGILVANVLCALGGLWWPLEIVSKPLREIGLILPSGLTVNVLDKIVYFDEPFSNLIPQISILFLISSVFFLFSYFVFKRKAI